jgi:hypothetical protein
MERAHLHICTCSASSDDINVLPSAGAPMNMIITGGFFGLAKAACIVQLFFVQIQSTLLGHGLLLLIDPPRKLTNT